MNRIALMDESGKALLPQDLHAMAELHEAAEKARALVRECDRLADLRIRSVLPRSRAARLMRSDTSAARLG
jgi:hypothetical protein